MAEHTPVVQYPQAIHAKEARNPPWIVAPKTQTLVARRKKETLGDEKTPIRTPNQTLKVNPKSGLGKKLAVDESINSEGKGERRRDWAGQETGERVVTWHRWRFCCCAAPQATASAARHDEELPCCRPQYLQAPRSQGDHTCIIGRKSPKRRGRGKIFSPVREE